MQFSLNDLIISSGWSSYSKNVLFVYCLGIVFNFPFLVELVESLKMQAFFCRRSSPNGPPFDTDRS